MFPDATALTFIIKHHHTIVKCTVHTVMGIEITASWNVTPHSFVQSLFYLANINSQQCYYATHVGGQLSG